MRVYNIYFLWKNNVFVSFSSPPRVKIHENSIVNIRSFHQSFFIFLGSKYHNYSGEYYNSWFSLLSNAFSVVFLLFPVGQYTLITWMSLWAFNFFRRQPAFIFGYKRSGRTLLNPLHEPSLYNQKIYNANKLFYLPRPKFIDNERCTI
jgi:hypothetical protein